ncbi:keywimysin-related RiPP [Streptomyces sp. NPDC059999]|nr:MULTISPECIES: keywimysin-related RiPP [unclassified Streptomyces]MCY0920164.1 keywimysin-related RiPP [Streptomyces sp. H27-G5]
MLKKSYETPVFAAAGTFRADTGIGLPALWDWHHHGGMF